MCPARYMNLSNVWLEHKVETSKLWSLHVQMKHSWQIAKLDLKYSEA
jgi:hypothetical protein